MKEEDIADVQGRRVRVRPDGASPRSPCRTTSTASTRCNLTPATIAKIFQLEITNWNDPAIAADNPDATLPDEPIVVVRRADGSGTTENFAKFLDAAVGAGRSTARGRSATGSELEWPEGTQAGDGNSGVAQLITDTPGVDRLRRPRATPRPTASPSPTSRTRPASSSQPTLEATTAAADEHRRSTTTCTFFTGWADGDDAYPIAAQTWIIVYTKQPDADTAAALQCFLTYLLTPTVRALAAGAELRSAARGDLQTKALANIAKIGA